MEDRRALGKPVIIFAISFGEKFHLSPLRINRNAG